MAPSAYVKPAESLKTVFKLYQKADVGTLDRDPQLIDFGRGITQDQNAHMHSQAVPNVHPVLRDYLAEDCEDILERDWLGERHPLAYSHDSFPGLCLIPHLLPLCVQDKMLNRLLHRDLADPRHQTNVHFHHTLNYPTGSFFDLNPLDQSTVIPINSNIHRPMSVRNFLCKKLRWCTLGGQYDWTRKVYPEEEPPAFPKDLQDLLHALFPKTIPQASIVNVYSPGDVLSLHRDVSEHCNNGLISISIGCDAVFLMALGGNEKSGKETDCLRIRLRSGDAVYMDGPTRYAWHGVPQVIPNTCPPDLENWPARNPCRANTTCDHDPYIDWKAWMTTKRVNLNVRQMRG